MPGAPAPVQYPERSSLQTQSIVLIVVGALCGGMIPTILGIIALVQLDQPTTARSLVRWGWISLIIIAALIVLFLVASFLVPSLMIGLMFWADGTA
ncbi:hypothetical protein [Brachybacterium endophyticum]|nr:hypothetical protein [Brachybacterium endophyticum]